ncbi:MAG: Cell division ATP-binding protein FtsE [Parcubacteria group bacterium GW2011_GWA2_52_8]|nr:MAG: Cell division ATP-binding protein FtsE [Parcubacteria group bacterium GW2011_GWA2_52_8]
MIHFDSVNKIYAKEVVALHDLNFRIDAGEFVSIVGRSGAGKSTLIRLLIREEIPTSGVVYIEGLNIATIRSSDIPYLRRKIGVVFQDIKLLQTRTAFENVAFAMEAAGVPQNVINEEVPELLELVGLGAKLEAFPDELSGGEKQRVAIARALAHHPLLLLADEPTGNLDEVNAMEILSVLKKINDLGTTVVLATHARGDCRVRRADSQ